MNVHSFEPESHVSAVLCTALGIEAMPNAPLESFRGSDPALIYCVACTGTL